MTTTLSNLAKMYSAFTNSGVGADPANIAPVHRAWFFGKAPRAGPLTPLERAQDELLLRPPCMYVAGG